jgi:hypothetical protein
VLGIDGGRGARRAAAPCAVHIKPGKLVILAFTSVLPYDVVVELEDFEDAADLVGEAVLLGEGLDHGAQLGEVVAGHRREQVVLQLILHPAEQVFGDEVVAVDSASGEELVSGEAVL